MEAYLVGATVGGFRNKAPTMKRPAPGSAAVGPKERVGRDRSRYMQASRFRGLWLANRSAHNMPLVVNTCPRVWLVSVLETHRRPLSGD
jgi:hypothetical protein